MDAIDAWYIRGKLALRERLDLLGGVRRETIFIETLNDAYVRDPVSGEVTELYGGPITFPSRYLLFDRLDNPFIGEVIVSNPSDLERLANATYNDQFLVRPDTFCTQYALAKVSLDKRIYLFYSRQLRDPLELNPSYPHIRSYLAKLAAIAFITYDTGIGVTCEHEL